MVSSFPLFPWCKKILPGGAAPDAEVDEKMNKRKQSYRRVHPNMKRLGWSFPDAAAANRLVALREGLKIGLMRMTRERVLELYFMEARAKLIDVAAFLDRVERAEGRDDFRLTAFRRALQELQASQPNRAERVLLSLSDPTHEPLAAATTKAAAGAWPGAK